MKKFVPEWKIMPFWVLFIMQCIAFASIGIIYTSITKDNNIQYNNLVLVLLFFGLFISYALLKLLSTVTPVSLIQINPLNESIEITYFRFFLIRKKMVRNFYDLSYKITNDSMLFGLATSIRFYIPNQKKYKVKLNHRNGWTRNQIKEVIAELQKHPEIKQLKGWYSI